MKLLVVGGGGREHTIIKKLKENPNVEEIFACPGNGGMAEDATLVPIGAKEIDKIVKEYMSGQFRDGDKKVEIPGKKYIWTLTKSVRKSVDNDALKADGLYEKYLKESESYTLKKAVIEEAE